MVLRKFISSALGGVERACIDAAIESGMCKWGGWAPGGKVSDDGEIPERYFNETVSGGLIESEEGRKGFARNKNIKNSDGILILRYTGSGIKLGKDLKSVISVARNQGKPYRIFDLNSNSTVVKSVEWICKRREACDEELDIRTVFVTGVSELHYPGTYNLAKRRITDIINQTYIHDRWKVKIWK